MDKKIIAVLGATGAQGGGLANTILSDKNSEFSVRAITRDVNSDKAKALTDKGAEVVKADVDDANIITNAFKGAYGVFAVTFFWEHFSPEKELNQAKIFAQAAKDTGVKHLIWSTLEDTRNWIPLDDDRMPTLGGKYKVPHYDAKGESNKFFEEANVPTTYLNTSFYWDNFIYFGMGPKKGDDGNYYFAFPMDDKKLPGIAAEDIGKCAYGIFKNYDKYVNKSVGIAGGHLTGYQMADAMSQALNKPIKYNPVSPEVYRGFGFPGADDLGNMFQFKRDFEAEYCSARNLDESRSLNPELLTFDAWLAKYKERIPLD
ncbi:MAG: NmrA/HSCARG family protein [Melioribacteraceae bacterium]|nr:MAG: NmrA/HSCARG family protein [Melioribacteraceae bacterium]